MAELRTQQKRGCIHTVLHNEITSKCREKCFSGTQISRILPPHPHPAFSVSPLSRSLHPIPPPVQDKAGKNGLRSSFSYFLFVVFLDFLSLFFK